MSLKHTALSAITLALALAAGVVTALPAAAAQAPMAAMFMPGSTALTPAGEHWLDAQMARKAQSARLASQLLIVKLPGAENTLQVRRAQVLRERLAALGAVPDQVYFEAGGH